MDAQRAFSPVLSGSVPPPATGFHHRPETGFGLADALRPGTTVLLVPAAGSDPSGGTAAAGATVGTGKTQLAVGFAHAMWSSRAVDLLVWVPAGNRTAIIAGFARAAVDLNIAATGQTSETAETAGTAETADQAARRFLGWLRRTGRRWAVVLDGVRSPADVDGLWPGGPAGQVVVTSRLRAAELGGAGRTARAVPGFSRREALGYLNARLTGFPDQRIEALDLAEDLGRLPIAMSQAAAVITVTGSTCRDYRAEYAERLRSTEGTLVDGCPRSLVATWSLAVERAHGLAPAGLAWPALAFAAALDTGGIPAAVLTAPAARGYILGRHDVPGRPAAGADGERNLVRAAYGNLERLGLISVQPANAVRTVWLHPAVRAAIRAYLAPRNVEQAVGAAAAALTEVWPGHAGEGWAGRTGSDGDGTDGAWAGETWADGSWAERARTNGTWAGGAEAGGGRADPERAAGAEVRQVLRDCASALQAFAGDPLWKPQAHPVLIKAGLSLAEQPVLAESAIGYWEAMATTCARLLGHGHAQTALSRDRLAAGYAAAGRLAEALTVFEAALADRDRELGPEHPDTLAARLNVARSLEAAGRHAEAIDLYEHVLRVRERMPGAACLDALEVRRQLAAAYAAAGRRGESVAMYEQALADTERELGTAHPDTLAARAGLAGAYQAAGRLREAVAAHQRAVAGREQVHGPDHPQTMAARASLANAYRLAGKLKEATAICERVLADRERVQGADHLDTVTARGTLAFVCRSAGKFRDAVPQYERALADRERLQGPEHPDTLTARANLAATYRLARRPREAVAAYERALADCERYLGADHPITAAVRENLRAAG